LLAGNTNLKNEKCMSQKALSREKAVLEGRQEPGVKKTRCDGRKEGTKGGDLETFVPVKKCDKGARLKKTAYRGGDHNHRNPREEP